MGGSSGGSSGSVGSGGGNSGFDNANPKSFLNALTNPLANISGSGPSQQSSGPPAWAIPYLKSGLTAAQAAQKSGAGAVAGFTPDQLAGQKYLEQYAGQLKGMIGGADSSLSFLTNPNLLDPNSNPYLKGSVNAADQSINDQFLRTVLPNINSGALANGAFGGSRQGVAQGDATNAYLRTIGNTNSTMYSDAYQKGLSTMLQGLGLTPSIMEAGQIPGNILNSVGATQQQLQQAKNNQPFTQDQMYANLIEGLIPGLGTTQTVPGPSQMQNATALLSMIGAFASMFGGSSGGSGGGAGGDAGPGTPYVS